MPLPNLSGLSGARFSIPVMSPMLRSRSSLDATAVAFSASKVRLVVTARPSFDMRRDTRWSISASDTSPEAMTCSAASWSQSCCSCNQSTISCVTSLIAAPCSDQACFSCEKLLHHRLFHVAGLGAARFQRSDFGGHVGEDVGDGGLLIDRRRNMHLEILKRWQAERVDCCLHSVLHRPGAEIPREVKMEEPRVHVGRETGDGVHTLVDIEAAIH